MADEKKQIDEIVEKAGKEAGADPQQIEDVKTEAEALNEVAGAPPEFIRATAKNQFDPKQAPAHHEAAEKLRELRQADPSRNDDEEDPR